MASTHDLTAQKLFSVKDYVCVITGGGTGIGLMAAQSLAANGGFEQYSFIETPADNGLGAKVYITSRRGEVLDKTVQEHDPGQNGGSIISCVQSSLQTTQTNCFQSGPM
jgi:hypothetical protein